MAKISVFEAGHCFHPACVVLRGAGWRPCAFPARAWLIEAGGRRWLWDTGYASHFADHTRSGVFRLYPMVTPVHFDSGQSLRAQLAAQGLQPRDLDGIIASHFHADHIAGLRDFPGLPIICSGSGWAVTRQRRGLGALRRAFVPGLMPPDTESRLRFIEGFEPVALPAALAPFGSGWALPGSQREVLLVELPGHAAGHIGAFVLSPDGWQLLAADAAWAAQNYTESRPPSRLTHLIMEDIRAYHHTLDRLHQLHRSSQGRVAILLTHDGAAGPTATPDAGEGGHAKTSPAPAPQATQEAASC